MITDRKRYLNPINFATNFAFFRDVNGQHTRLVTANYWSGYGAKDTAIWFTLLDEYGSEIARWHEALQPGASSVVVDSVEVRRRLGLGDFTGQLFLHVVNAAGHDIVKYALDTYGDDSRDLSCTHDANAWPSDLYGGLPAPTDEEQVVLWVQNSHPCPIPRRGIGLNRMGAAGGRMARPRDPAVRNLCARRGGAAAGARLAGADRSRRGQAFRPARAMKSSTGAAGGGSHTPMWSAAT